jgi:transcriptional regulator with XRE-family HTH domain
MASAVTRARDLDGLLGRIVTVRTRRGLPQRAFAARVGVSRNIVIRWERGHHRPRAAALERLAAAGEVSVDWLLRGDGQPRRARRGPTLKEAVALLRVAWRESSGRAGAGAAGAGRRPGMLGMRLGGVDSPAACVHQ